MKSFMKGEYESVLRYYDQHDFFCDFPTPLLYKLIFYKYGRHASYILTMRSDSKTWYESLVRHNMYAHPLKNKHKKIYGRYYPHGFIEEHIAYYERHNSDIINFFEANHAKDKLLILTPDVEDPVPHLENFLGSKFQNKSFPHVNKSSERVKKRIEFAFRKKYNEVITPLYARWARRLFPGPPRRLYPVELAEAGSLVASMTRVEETHAQTEPTPNPENASTA